MTTYLERCKQLKERFEAPHEVAKRNLALYRQLSGRALAEEITASNPDLVIDLGCGSNEFKSVCPNVIGVDVADLPGVDIVQDIDTFRRNCIFQEGAADWVLCFGPLNYGGSAWVRKLMAAFAYLVSDTGTVVCHVHPENSELDWTTDTINYWGKTYGFAPTDFEIGYTDTALMDEADLAIQHQVATRDPGIAMSLAKGDTLVRPMIVWRWKRANT